MTTHPGYMLAHTLSEAGMHLLETIGKNDFLVLGHDSNGPYYASCSDRLDPPMVALRFDDETVKKLLFWRYLYKKALTHELRATPLGLAARDIERKRLKVEAKRLERERIARDQIDRERAAEAEERVSRGPKVQAKRERQAIDAWERAGRAEAARMAEASALAIKARDDADRAARKAAQAAKKTGASAPPAQKIMTPMDEYNRGVRLAKQRDNYRMQKQARETAAYDLAAAKKVIS